jgi:hypothetical protein
MSPFCNKCVNNHGTVPGLHKCLYTLVRRGIPLDTPLRILIKCHLEGIERVIRVTFSVPILENYVSTSPAVSTVREKVIRERNVPPEELAAEQIKRNSLDFWDLIESLTPQRWADEDWRLAIVREDPKPSTYGGQNTLEQCQGTLETRPGVSIPLDDREQIQLGIKQKYGGRSYRLILKKGRERITEGKCMNEAPPKYPETMGYPVNGMPPLPSATDASVASKAIDAMASQQPDAMRLAMEVLRSASDIVMRSAQPGANPSPTSSSLIDQEVVRTLIQKALNPPPPPPPPPAVDPFEMFAKFKEILAPPATNGVKETLELVASLRNSGLFPAGSGKTSLLDLGREVIPTIATTAREAVHEWRLGVEAQVRGLELSRGINPQPPAVPPQPIAAAPAATPPAAAAPPQTGGNEPPSGEPPFDWLAMKIVDILREPSYSIDEAVDETLSFLYRAHAPIVAQLLDPPKLNAQLAAGEQGLLMLFQHHPVLKQIPVNPRLAEFIKKFVVAAKEAEAERMAGAKPVAPAAAAAAVPPSA